MHIGEFVFMSDLMMNLRGSSKNLTVQFIMPIAAILATAIGIVIATAIWTSEDIDQTSIDQQKYRMQSAIEDQKSERSAQLSKIVLSDELLNISHADPYVEKLNEIISRKKSSDSDFNDIFIVSQDGSLLAGNSQGEQVSEREYKNRTPFFKTLLSEIKSKIQQRNFVPQTADKQTITADLSRSVLISDGKRHYFVAATPLVPANKTNFRDWQFVIGMKRIDGLWLQNFGSHLGLDSLQISDKNKINYFISINSTEKAPSVYLSWSPYLPGQVIRSRLIPVSLMVILSTLIFSTIIFIRVRKIEKDLTNSEDKARQLIGHDPLSGLANRLLFSMRLDQELARLGRDSEGLAVFFLDLDRFKDVNDTHGHQAGDELIKEVAKRLSNLLRGTDTLSRFGGDEFAIIQPNIKRTSDAERLGRRILEVITEPFAIAGTQVTVGVSIGIALAPENGTERETLMQLADTALYQSKNDGRNRYSFFENQMNESLRMRKLVEDELRIAIDNNSLALYYQPQVSPDGKTILGVEALVRWPHPTKGLISPVQFISIAEERGLIVPLGEWVLRRACIDGLRWPNVTVAVNVSPIQFRHKEFVTNVKRILSETGFPPSRLEIELTEGVVVEDADAAEWAMMELKALGVHLALDDFGTGYSSLIYLRRFAFDKIKIDRSFLESMEATGESAILVHSIVHLGRALGLTVTAEGVETEEQHRFLQAVGCHELQGYLFSRPVPAHEIDVKMNPATRIGLLTASS
jgi:diguanylate cyclase